MAHWVWGVGGWLRDLGALDFAGGTVIHILSGVSGLVACIMLGKRSGKGVVPMLPHHLPMTVLGAALLWFGWFGFNAGSALGANGLAAGAFVVTQAAAAAATLSWVGAEWLVNGHPTMLGAASGCIAGLVAITPAAGFVTVVPAVLIGLIGGVLCFAAVAIVKAKLGTMTHSTHSAYTALAAPGAHWQPAFGQQKPQTPPVRTGFFTATRTSCMYRG